MKEPRKYRLEVIGSHKSIFHFDTEKVALEFAQRVREETPYKSIRLYIAKQTVRVYELYRIIK